MLTNQTTPLREKTNTRKEFIGSCDGSKIYLAIQNYDSIDIESINMKPYEETQELNNNIVPRL